MDFNHLDWTPSLNDALFQVKPPDLSQNSITNSLSDGSTGNSGSFNTIEPTQASWNLVLELLNKFQQKVVLIGDTVQEMQVLSRRIQQAIDQIGVCDSVFAPSLSADFTSSPYTTRTSTLGKDVHRLDMSDDHPAYANITHIPFATVSVQSNRQLYAGLSMTSNRTSTEVYAPTGVPLQPSPSKSNSNGSPFVCHECDYKTKRKGDLKRHREGQCHSKPKYACPCGKSFTRNYTLNNHAKKCRRDSLLFILIWCCIAQLHYENEAEDQSLSTKLENMGNTSFSLISAITTVQKNTFLKIANGDNAQQIYAMNSALLPWTMNSQPFLKNHEAWSFRFGQRPFRNCPPFQKWSKNGT
ncbi:hypothetical protein F5887DRAFT_917944 [Amanita rubescens]|nr:hypothetical protein F5887DRAFT_917944 [Amanita rubescens]